MADTREDAPGSSDRLVVEVDRREPAVRPTAAIVVGIDRSAASLAGLDKAAELGIRLGATLHVVHAVDLSDYPVDPDTDDWEDQASANLEAEGLRVSEVLAGYPCGWSYLAVRAEPSEALGRVARQVRAAMIVVGVRAHGWGRLLERLASPSVAHRLISHSQVPVLVVSYHEHDREG